MCCKSRGALSRLGLLWGVAAMATLLVAFAGGSWLYTREPVTLASPQVTTAVSFRIGLWKACPSIKRINSTIHLPSQSCTFVKYNSWEDTRLSGDWASPLDLAQVFVNRMRSCTVLCGSAVGLLALAVFLALFGHCNCDSKTIVACGFFILGGLSLGTGLVVFASALSETLLEIQQYHKDPPNGLPKYDYRYGWCFFAAGFAFIMAKMAAVFSLTGYLNRFSSVDEMVREMVPGAERKLLEHQRFASELHPRPPPTNRYDPLPSDRPTNRYEPELGPLLTKTPPDVCTSSSACAELSIEQSFAAAHAQTVPITIKNPGRYGTMPAGGTTLHQGFLGVADLGSSSSNSSGGAGCAAARSKTLQHPGRQRKKCVKIESFQGPEVGPEAGRRTNSNAVGFAASAV